MLDFYIPIPILRPYKVVIHDKILSLNKYTCMQSGYLKSFEPFINLGIVYTILIKVEQRVWCLKSHTFLHQYIGLTKHSGLSLAHDASMIQNDLPDDVCSATSLSLFRKKLNIYLFAKAFLVFFLVSPNVFPWC